MIGEPIVSVGFGQTRGLDLPFQRRRHLGVHSGLGSDALPRDPAWEAIAAGVLVAVVGEFMASLAGFGLGEGLLSSRTAGGSPVLSSPSAIVSFAGVVLSLAAGGFTAARLGGARVRFDSLVCGLLTFSTALIVVIIVLTQNLSAVIDRGLGPVGNVIAVLSAPAGREHGGADPLIAFREEVRRSLDARVEGSVDDERADEKTWALVLSAVAETADRDTENQAVEAIVATKGLARPVAERQLTVWQIAHDRALRIQRRSAAALSGDVAGSCFAAFVMLAAGLLAALLGAILGRTDDPALEIAV